MKGVAIVVLALLAATTDVVQSAEKKYAGATDVAGLGRIALPAGEWSLEFQRIQAPTNDLQRPDYFVFKKLGDRVERLTFLRYPPTTPPRALRYMLDTVWETLGDGIPAEAKKDYNGEGEVHPMRQEPPAPSDAELTITFSFIHSLPPPAPSWLCHSYLFSHEGSAFVIAHASTSVTNPEIMEDVRRRSKFLPSTTKPRSWK